ncbi:ATP-dependent DNA helicase DinG [Litorivicinus lipolyticus]|uniref:ATP-dependent DNA helicase DinG n=1 Tax=Litorivicinus lipolyticus TaxID=418701 RepID=UPI0014788066|nr:ATP-dependent DNA helicase DinG [Litorivicinus lipolyticus]
MITDTLKNDIRTAYSAFNDAAGGESRPGQRHMLAWVTQGLMRDGGGKVVIEAGTGTGKTVGYLIPSLLCARELGKQVVISTATVALQNQLLQKDIPQLISSGALKTDAKLAKGRRRYLCPIRLEQAIADTQGQHEDEILFRPTTHQLGSLKGFYEQFADGSWDGDLDGWDESIDGDLIPMVTTDHAGCRGRQCEAINDCPFFAARDALDDAEVIITNHDLVLSDLSLGGGVVLPAPEDAIYVFDEGHQLAEKAINHQTGSLQLQSSINWAAGLPKRLDALVGVIGKTSELASTIRRIQKTLTDCVAALGAVDDSVRALIDREIDTNRWSESGAGAPLLRLSLDPIEAALQRQLADAGSPFRAVASDLGSVVDWLKHEAEKPNGELDREVARSNQGFFNKAKIRAEDAVSLLTKWGAGNSSGPEARWILLNGIERKSQWQDADPELWFSPASAGPGLSSSLWDACAGAVVCSATLAVGRSFDRLYQAIGLSPDVPCHMVGGAFDYPNQGQIVVPDIAVDPTQADAHDQAILAHAQTLIGQNKGTLILFSSRAQLRRVTELLSTGLSAQVLSQLELGRYELLKHHRLRRERGQPSIIFGMQSYGEGIDLPGDLLEEVVITRLPFSQPDDPIHATYAEWVERQGLRSFSAITLPMASIRLRQAVGRLIRSASDTGTVTFLDNRVKTKGYGRQLLDDLPPFRRVGV